MIYAVQRTANKKKYDRFERLRQNITTVLSLRRHMPQVTPVNTDIKSFILDHMEEESDISILNLDPPWALGNNPNVISSNGVIKQFLMENVFEPCQMKQINPKIICLKVPNSIQGVENWPNLTTGYILHSHIHVRNKFFIYILRRKQ